METIWQAEPKIFTIWLFIENVCQPVAALDLGSSSPAFTSDELCYAGQVA